MKGVLPRVAGRLISFTPCIPKIKQKRLVALELYGTIGPAADNIFKQSQQDEFLAATPIFFLSPDSNLIYPAGIDEGIYADFRATNSLSWLFRTLQFYGYREVIIFSGFPLEFIPTCRGGNDK